MWAMPLPTPRLAPVTTVTKPASLLVSEVPQMRKMDTQGSSGRAAGPETPAEHCGINFVTPKGATCSGSLLASGFCRKRAHVSWQSRTPLSSPARRKIINASRAAFSPSALAPFAWCTPAATFNALALPASSPNSSKIDWEFVHAARAASKSCRKTLTLASDCIAYASPFLSPAALYSATASSPLLRAASALPFATCASAICAQALASRALSPVLLATVNARIAVWSASSDRDSMSKEFAMICNAAHSIFLSPLVCARRKDSRAALRASSARPFPSCTSAIMSKAVASSVGMLISRKMLRTSMAVNNAFSVAANARYPVAEAIMAVARAFLSSACFAESSFSFAEVRISSGAFFPAISSAAAKIGLASLHATMTGFVCPMAARGLDRRPLEPRS
mmetsp:Transcript_68240/g.171990  ORF Transcript_68240/g.171990 Transcript_68240/m.171990 type:complete len:394 (+) Transcript_68240:891-2072(+)